VASGLPAQSARRRLSQGELDLIVSAHERFIEGRPGGKRASLRFVDLTGLDLSDRNLSDADLSGSVFDNCKMARAKLERANLFGCDLKRTDLREAVMRRADLRGACLRGANVALADLSGADFREGQIGVSHPTKGLNLLRTEGRAGQLDQVNFAGAKLDGSQMEQISACASDFTDCSMKGAILSGANLKDANLSGANLEGAEIGGAILENVNFVGAVLTGVDVRRARSSTGAKMGGNLGAPSETAIARTHDLLERAKANQMWCDTGGKHGSPAKMDAEDLRPMGLRLRGFRLTAMSAKGACLVGLDMTGCQLQGSNFEGADLRSVCFKDADLRGARLGGSDPSRFHQCDPGAPTPGRWTRDAGEPPRGQAALCDGIGRRPDRRDPGRRRPAGRGLHGRQHRRHQPGGRQHHAGQWPGHPACKIPSPREWRRDPSQERLKVRRLFAAR